MRRALMVLVLGLFLASCAKVVPADERPAALGTVTGTVTVRACGGAYRPESTGCQPQPMDDARLSFSQAGGPVTNTTTDSSGHYLVRLSPGTYQVQVNGQSSSNKLSQVSGSKQLTVVAGQTQTLDFTITIELL
jgi:hypothetical protein